MFELKPDAFAAAVALACQKAGMTAELVYDSEEFSLKSPTDDTGTLYLANAYDIYRRLPFWQRGRHYFPWSSSLRNLDEATH